MLSLSAKIRKEPGKRIKDLRGKGILPAVLYGPKIKDSLSLEIDSKEFEKIYKEAGGSSLISLETEGKKFPVLIYEVQRDPLSGKVIHVDFYQPSLDEEVEVALPIILEGEAPAVKNFEGTLVKNISEIKVKALPQKLPHEIKINIDNLENLEDTVKIKDLKMPEGVEALREPEEIIISVARPEKIEEELEKPIEEKVEEVERVEEKKEEEKEVEQS